MPSDADLLKELEMLRLRKQRAMASRPPPAPAAEPDPAPEQQEVPEPSTAEQFGLTTKDLGPRLMRQGGLTLRALVEGATGLPAMIADAPVNAARAFGYNPPIKTSTEAISSLLNRAGVPEPKTNLEKAVNLSAQAIMPGYGGAKAGVRLSEIGSNTAENIMLSTLKPTLRQHELGEGRAAARTLLNERANVTEGGIRKLRGMIDSINSRIEKIIETSGKRVDLKHVVDAIDEEYAKTKYQALPAEDLATIRKGLNEFLANHPLVKPYSSDIPLDVAQRIKQGTYRRIEDKFGELSSADVQTQKAIARGLKEGIVKAEPSLRWLNKRESELLNAMNVTERRVFMDLNKDHGSLAYYYHNPKAAAAMIAGKSAPFRSLFARAINRVSKQGDVAGAAGGVTLYELAKGVPGDED